MIVIGDVHIYVSEFDRAINFWSKGLGFAVSDTESSENGQFARLDAPLGGPSIRIFAPVEPWGEDEVLQVGMRPMIRFDVATDEFEQTLARLLEHGGSQDDEVETYDGARVVTVLDPDGNSFDLIELFDMPEEGDEG